MVLYYLLVFFGVAMFGLGLCVGLFKETVLGEAIAFVGAILLFVGAILLY